MTISPTDMRQVLWCPRILFYNRILGIYAPDTGSMRRGRQRGEEIETLLMRRDWSLHGLNNIKIKKNMALRNLDLGLVGNCDAVIDAPDEIIPVEIKNGTSIKKRHIMQLVAYALLLGNAKKPCNRGIILLGASPKVEWIEITITLKEEALKLMDHCFNVLDTDEVPEGTSQRGKCVNCEYLNYCYDRQ